MEHTFRAVIIDDEPDGRNIVALLLGQLFPQVSLVGEANSVATGIALVRDGAPDLIFLDIRMPDGTAFDLLKACGPLQAKVIFITAYDHYAIQAIKASVADYLLKPLNKQEFADTVTRVIQLERQPDAGALLPQLLEEIRKMSGVRKVRIPTVHGFSLANADDILRCEASGNYTIVFFKDHHEMTSRSLGEYEEELSLLGFVRIHHKHLVNINHIKEYNKGKNGGGYVTILGRPEQLEVSARKKPLLLRAIGR